MRRPLRPAQATRAVVGRRWTEAALALWLCIWTATAQAQSSVVAFGVLDLNVRHVRDGVTSLNSVSSNGLSPSRWGFKGSEDLGDGESAGFWLEGAILPDTGTQGDPSRIWNRRSTVSLTGSMGEVRLGRDFTPTYVGYALYDVFGAIGLATVDKFVTTFGTTVDTLNRSDNLVSYFTPEGVSRFYGRLSVAPGEGTVGKRYTGGRVGYLATSFDVSMAYSETRVARDAQGRDRYENFDVAGWYDFKLAKLTGHVTSNRFGGGRLTVTNIGISTPFGSHLIRASYVRADSSGRNALGADIDHNDATQWAIGYVRQLSKRTSVYSTAVEIRNEGAAAFVAGSPPAFPWATNGHKNSVGVEGGIRHIF